MRRSGNVITVYLTSLTLLLVLLRSVRGKYLLVVCLAFVCVVNLIHRFVWTEIVDE